MHYVISAVRLAYDDKVGAQCRADRRAGSAAWREPLYGHETPDGYPLAEPRPGPGPGQMATRFEIARAIGSGSARLVQAATGQQAVDQPAFPQFANALYFMAACDPTLGAATTARRSSQAISPQDWNTLVPGLARIHAPLNQEDWR